MGRHRRGLVKIAALCLLAAGGTGCASGSKSSGAPIQSSATSAQPTSSTEPAPLERIVETQADSMAPTMIRGDRIALGPVSAPLARGDIVAYFGHPPSKPDEEFFLHRVVGLPGEKVEGRAGVVLINGQPLAEPYVPAEAKIGDFPGANVPPDTYWIMGDNRPHAADSRVFGPIPKSQIAAVATRIDEPAGRRRKLP